MINSSLTNSGYVVWMDVEGGMRGGGGIQYFAIVALSSLIKIICL
jgi:hypothetical protein